MATDTALSDDPRPATEQRRILACELALGKLSKDERLRGIALDNIRIWERDRTCSSYYPRRWRELLSQPVRDIREFLLGPSEEAASLRQNNPFAGFFDEAERRQLLETCRRDQRAARAPH